MKTQLGTARETAQPHGRRAASKGKLLHVVTAPMGVEAMLSGQLRFLREAGFEVTVVSAPGAGLNRVAAADGVDALAVPMAREIAPFGDLAALWRLWRLMRRLRPAICHVGTPKAGLVGGLAAWLAGVPHRFYTLHGLRLETAAGPKRALLTLAERTSCRLAQRVICVSESLRKTAIELGVAGPQKLTVVGPGSANGVDEARFAATELRQHEADALRRTLGVPRHAPVAGFVGRLTRDKGIVELLEAFELLKRRFPELRLLLVGSFEKGDPLPPGAKKAISSDPCIIPTGFVDDPSLLYRLMDVVVLPSYREGFPTVALEAAAAGKPVVATRVTGSCDAVVDQETGILVPVQDSDALARAVGKVLQDKPRARSMGLAGQRRARQFAPEKVWRGVLAFYEEALNAPQAKDGEFADTEPALLRVLPGNSRPRRKSAAHS